MARNSAFLAASLLITFSWNPASAETGRSMVLILDASGSMNASLREGGSRIIAAKAAVADLVGTLAPDTRLAFRVYGHQSPPQQKNCKDSALVVGFDTVAANKAAVLEKASGIRAQGYTPINLSLQLAAQDLASEPSAERTVLLVSDGKETCEGDPCATAKALADADAKLVVHTVGFGVDAVTRQQLMCIARMGRGSYFDAANAGELSRVLAKAAATKGAPPVDTRKLTTAQKNGKLKMEVKGGHSWHDVLNASGQKVHELFVAQSVVELPPGIYSVKFTNGSWTGIEVRPGETTEIKPGYLEIEPMGANYVYVLEPETAQVVDEFFRTKASATVIPGRFDVKVGQIQWLSNVEVKPGETTTLTPGLLEVKSDLGVFTFSLRTLDGQDVAAGDVPGQTRLALPPGKYMMDIDPDKWIKKLSDEQRKTAIEIIEGRVLELVVD